MAKAQLRASSRFSINDRIELTQEGERKLAGIRSRTGTVVGFGLNSTLQIVVDGNSMAASFSAGLWRLIEAVQKNE
ncbi:MAG TPA: hypothetical protein VJ728_10390 [Candidatus Binataceae bacterium]|nr:hypothetical protein [Candidatus Binataceae bacterium]